MKRRILRYLIFISALLYVNCAGQETKETDMTAPERLTPIYIKAPKFFYETRPWRDGKLVTIDGWGRFAEISFSGANSMRISTLVGFPRTFVDSWNFKTWPQAGLISSSASDVVHHLAAIDDKKTKTHMPLFTRHHFSYTPVLLDPHEGLVAYSYLGNDRYDVDVYLYIYNYKEDRMIYENEENRFSILMRMAINEQYQLSSQISYDGSKREYKTIFYDWRTGEIATNDLTETLNNKNISFSSSNIHTTRRYLFAERRDTKQALKIDWDENFSNIRIVPLFYLLPEGINLNKKLDDSFVISTDGNWATTRFGSWRGLENEYLDKRVFFHMDDRYPNGISVAVINDDYEESIGDDGVFVEHPVHGMCFVQEWHKEGGRFLRLYKMNDVLAEINRQIAE